MKTKILHTTITIFTIFLLSCSSSDNTSKRAFGIPDKANLEELALSIDNYNAIGIALIEREREELQLTLGKIIKEQVGVYRKLIDEWEIKKIYATSQNEYNNYLVQENEKALDSLIAKDIYINLVYFKLIEKLENLNTNYSKEFDIPLEELKSFYDLDKIILSDEVSRKIQELIKDDKKRTEKLVKETRNEVALLGLDMALRAIPVGGEITRSTINSISTGLKYAKQGKSLAEGAATITKISYGAAETIKKNNIGSKVINSVINKLSNETKRIEMATTLTKSAKKNISSMISGSSIQAYDYLNSRSINLSKTREQFKVIENKIEGRIGDYSDGILTVHLQDIREKIKYNQTVLNKYKTS